MGPDHRWPLWHPNRPSTPGRSGHLNGTILIYGATGYTGELVARVAADQGARPILAGRNLEKVEAVAKPLGLTARAFDLRDPGRINAAIGDVSVVLCVAGSFWRRRIRWRTLSPQSSSVPRHHRGNRRVRSPRGAGRRSQAARRDADSRRRLRRRAERLPRGASEASAARRQ